MVNPERLYWLALVLLVLPSVLVNRMAIAVLSVWAFGHLVHWAGPFESHAYMFAAIVAVGASLAISRPWDRSVRSYLHLAIAFLFLQIAFLHAYAAVQFTHDPQTWAEYRHQTSVYWFTWASMMTQALLVPLSNDWDKVREIVSKVDDWLIKRIVKHFDGAI